jgi:TetR/AcrR family transcriptional regulator
MKRDDILDAALEEFSKYDYDRASINSIIKNSDTSKGTFYHYFESKEALYLELIKLASQEKLKYLKEKISVADTTKDMSIFGLIKKQMENSIHFGLTNPKFAKFSVKVANETNTHIKEEAQATIGSSVSDYLKQLINNEISNGRIRDDLPKEFIFEIFGYMMTRFNDFIAHGGIIIDISNEEKIMNYISYYLDFMENGLGHAKN